MLEKNVVKNFLLSFFPKGPIFTESNHGFKAILDVMVTIFYKYMPIKDLVLNEYDPNTVYYTLDDWEETFNITHEIEINPDEVEGDFEDFKYMKRIQRLNNKINEETIENTKISFCRFCQAYGYEVEINENKCKTRVKQINLPFKLETSKDEFFVYFDIKKNSNDDERGIINRDIKLFDEIKSKIPINLTFIFRKTLENGGKEILCVLKPQ